ncbi:hypothetical protein LWC35_30275, partial [Pseudonocardia kujensis]|nr:hypothetical protein [Pseudonocardia kujensis]
MATFEHRVGNPLPPDNPVTVADLLRRGVPAQRTAAGTPEAAPAAQGPAESDGDRRPLPRIPAPRPAPEDLVGRADDTGAPVAAAAEPAEPVGAVLLDDVEDLDESPAGPVTGGHALPDPEDPRPSQIISVGALLRREGRAPHALDRPIQPRPAQVGRRSHPGVRRAAVTAGALVATGSVVAAAVF